MQAINEYKIDKKQRRKKFRDKLAAQKYLQIMILLGVLWMLIFNYLPMIGIVLAFKKYNIAKPMFESIISGQFVGLRYFKEFLQDENLMTVLKNTLGISFYKLLIGFPLPIIFALFLNELSGLKFKKFVQTVSYLPHFLSWVVLGGILISWLSDVGFVNEILMKFNLIHTPVNYLAKPGYFWAVAVISDIWKELGWSAIIYLAAIASIDQEMYEAATIDGAGRFAKMFSITLPCIKPTIAILFILAMGGILNSNFDQIFVLTNSLNQSASDVIDVYVYRVGIQNARFSYAIAVGLLKSIVALGLLLTANFMTKKLSDSAIF